MDYMIPKYVTLVIMMDYIIPKYVTLVIMMDHIIPKYVKHPGNAFFAKKKAPVAGSNGGEKLIMSINVSKVQDER